MWRVMLTVDCRDILPIKNELLVHVSDRVMAIPTLKNNQFTLSKLDDDDILDASEVISAIREYLDSIGEGSNFAVISNNNMIGITSISGKKISQVEKPKSELFSCTHCGFVTQYEVDLNAHVRIHYL